MKKQLLLILLFAMNLVAFATEHPLSLDAALPEQGTEIPFDQWGHVKLSDFVGYDDDNVVKLILNVKPDGDRAPGWGVGKIIPINLYSATTFMDLACQAVSEEGELNEYTFTIGQMKELAKVDGEYYTDDYDQQGVTINVYDNVERVSLTVYSAGTPQEPGSSFTFDDLEDGAYPLTVGDGAAATVVTDPAKDGKALQIVLSNYDSMPAVEVVLPEGVTFGNILSISFDTYATASNWKETMINVNGTFVYKPGSYPQALWENEWRTIRVAATDFDASAADFASLNSFTLGIGLNDNAMTYYIDNIVIELDEISGIGESIIIPARNPIISFQGGIEVDNDGAKIVVFGLDGRKVLQTTDSRIYLEKGVYLVQIGNSVYKTVIR